MKLPKQLFEDIGKYKIEYWHEIWFDKLFERFIELKEKELYEYSISKKEYISTILDGYDGSEEEFIDRTVDVYMDD